MKVANYMELIVTDKMESILKGTNTCLCEMCKSDIAAIALNNLKPHYFATDKGFLFSKLKALEVQALADVATQITHAAALVSSRPRH